MIRMPTDCGRVKDALRSARMTVRAQLLDHSAYRVHTQNPTSLPLNVQVDFF